MNPALQRLLRKQFLLSLFSIALALPSPAAPSVSQAIPDRALVTNNGETSIYLAAHFANQAGTTSGLSFSATTSNAAVVAVEVTSATLTLKPVAAGMATITARATEGGSFVEDTFQVTVSSSPQFSKHPDTRSTNAGGNMTLSVAATPGATLAWQRNGSNLNIATPNIDITNMQPSLAGVYTAEATSGGVTVRSNPGIIGITTTSKVVGSGTEIDDNIKHPNGNVFDQVLLQGPSAAITADYNSGQITRMSYIDLTDDIVQVEFSGPGTLAIYLDESSSPAKPVNYTQDVSYVKGHASIVITGADHRTNVSVFTVGRATAFDPTGTYNILQSPGPTNNPANNKSPLFVGHEATNYDGIADIARISITSTNGRFGGIRTANTYYFDVKGMTGIYAPGVTFEGPVYIGNLSAYGSAKPVLVLGAANDETRVAGGDFLQANGQPIQVSGITQLVFAGGVRSSGAPLDALTNRGQFRRDGQNVTSQIVVNP